MHETNALLPGYSRVWYDPNPKFGQAPFPSNPRRETIPDPRPLCWTSEDC